jgi:hypothetical protein
MPNASLARYGFNGPVLTFDSYLSILRQQMGDRMTCVTEPIARWLLEVITPNRIFTLSAYNRVSVVVRAGYSGRGVKLISLVPRSSLLTVSSSSLFVSVNFTGTG